MKKANKKKTHANHTENLRLGTALSFKSVLRSSLSSLTYKLNIYHSTSPTGSEFDRRPKLTRNLHL